MKTKDQILTEALATADPSMLYILVEQALELAQFNAARDAFARGQIKTLQSQIDRQRAMIDNLENTLFKRK